MKKLLITSLLATFAAVQASAISIVDFTPNSAGPGVADVTFTGFADGAQSAFAILPGVTLAYNSAVIVQGGANNSEGAMPFPTTGSDYLSVKKGGQADFVFASALERTFGFQWGSIDAYNTISFLLNGVLQTSFTGSQVVSSPVAANGNQGLNGSAYVTFAGVFDAVRLTSSGNSFEIDNLSVQAVPDAGTTVALLGASLLGLAFFRRFAK